jgi:hypothetical protein
MLLPLLTIKHVLHSNRVALAAWLSASLWSSLLLAKEEILPTFLATPLCQKKGNKIALRIIDRDATPEVFSSTTVSADLMPGRAGS